MCTLLHTPNESDTALDLYNGDLESKFYTKNGYFGRPNFEELADRIGLVATRAQRIIDSMLGNQNEVLTMVENSFLDGKAKEKYGDYYKEKVRRFS
jgi:serine/threonine-protein kinase HipA